MGRNRRLASGTAILLAFPGQRASPLPLYLSTSDRRSYEPNRTEAETLQVLAVTNFKGGSGKTTTSAHLTQYLALRGYRVLAIDLDPQSSLSALFGKQPEADLEENDTLLRCAAL